MNGGERESGAGRRVRPAEALSLGGLIAYVPGSVVSRVLRKGSSGSLTLFAFDAGQQISEHTTPYDAFVLVLDGRADLVIGGQRVQAAAGQMVLMPGGVPHGLRAGERFKMLLVMLGGG